MERFMENSSRPIKLQESSTSKDSLAVQNEINKPYRATALLRKTRLLFFYEKPLISS